VVKQQAATAAAQQQGFAELKGIWGAAYDQKMQGIENTIHTLAQKIPGLSDAERSPEFIKLMDIVGDMLGEAGAVHQDPRTTMTTDEASAELTDLIEKMRKNPPMEGSRSALAYAEKRAHLRKMGAKDLSNTDMNGY